MGAAWGVLLLALWLWGREVTAVRLSVSAPVSGDVAAVGRPQHMRLPTAVRPLGDALPQRLDIPELGVQAPVVARGLDPTGTIDPPPFDRPGVVGWYADGVRPGTAGAALMVGHADTETRPAVFHRLGALKPGAMVRVLRDDGTVAEFTVEDVHVVDRDREDVHVVDRDRFDARQAYGAHRAGRAELRLITCGSPFDRATHSCTAHVIVSAYLTGTGL